MTPNAGDTLAQTRSAIDALVEADLTNSVVLTLSHQQLMDIGIERLLQVAHQEKVVGSVLRRLYSLGLISAHESLMHIKRYNDIREYIVELIGQLPGDFIVLKGPALQRYYPQDSYGARVCRDLDICFPNHESLWEVAKYFENNGYQLGANSLWCGGAAGRSSLVSLRYVPDKQKPTVDCIEVQVGGFPITDATAIPWETLKSNVRCDVLLGNAKVLNPTFQLCFLLSDYTFHRNFRLRNVLDLYYFLEVEGSRVDINTVVGFVRTLGLENSIYRVATAFARIPTVPIPRSLQAVFDQFPKACSSERISAIAQIVHIRKALATTGYCGVLLFIEWIKSTFRAWMISLRIMKKATWFLSLSDRPHLVQGTYDGGRRVFFTVLSRRGAHTIKWQIVRNRMLFACPIGTFIASHAAVLTESERRLLFEELVSIERNH